MPDAPNRNSRDDDLIGVIAVLVLLLGTATGNAIVMLVISLAGLGFVTGYYCGKLGGRTLLVVLVTALTAALIGTLMVTLLT